MANVQLLYTQSVADQIQSSKIKSTTGVSLSSIVDSVLNLNYAINSNYYYFSSWSLIGNTLKTTFANGATGTYIGTLSDPSASSGTANAANYSFNLPNVITVAETGSLNYTWQVGNNNSLSFYATDGIINSYIFSTKYPTTSASYNSVYGNGSTRFAGSVSFDLNQNLSGDISSITTTSDKFLKSSSINGSFSISGNGITVGQGLTNSSVTGTLSSYSDVYYDGSYLTATDTSGSVYLQNKQSIDYKILANANYFPNDDVISIELPSKIYEPWLIASGAGKDTVTLNGGGTLLSANLGDGNDTIILKDDGHTVDGGVGTDTAMFSGNRASYTTNKTSTGWTVSSTTEGVDTLTNIERLKFADTAIALDTSGVGGQTYRVYKAAFNRTPDVGGLGFWISGMDGGVSVNSVAQGFVNSAEFKTVYGASPTNAQIVTRFYDNVLGRAADSGGYNYWLGILDSGQSAVAQVLASFSESSENQAAVIGVIGNGILYTPYG